MGRSFLCQMGARLLGAYFPVAPSSIPGSAQDLWHSSVMCPAKCRSARKGSNPVLCLVQPLPGWPMAIAAASKSLEPERRHHCSDGAEDCMRADPQILRRASNSAVVSQGARADSKSSSFDQMGIRRWSASANNSTSSGSRSSMRRRASAILRRYADSGASVTGRVARAKSNEAGLSLRLSASEGMH